jgi:hypothetical protein
LGNLLAVDLPVKLLLLFELLALDAVLQLDDLGGVVPCHRQLLLLRGGGEGEAGQKRYGGERPAAGDLNRRVRAQDHEMNISALRDCSSFCFRKQKRPPEGGLSRN